MRIILFLILMITSLGANAAKRDVLFQNYEAIGQKILNEQEMSEVVKGNLQKFNDLKEELGEYKEVKVEELNEKVSLHVKNLEQRVFHNTKLVFLDFISWQREVTLKGPNSENTLIVTNRGWCAGGLMGQANQDYHYFVDGCFAYGSANVSSERRNVTYNEGNIPTWALKVSPGLGVYVSSARVELGLKLPLMYTNQTFTKPNQNSFPGYKVRDDSSLSMMGSIYSRWPFGNWFLQTELAKVLGNDLILYSLGAGYKF